MADFTIIHKIEAPELVAAIVGLTDALCGRVTAFPVGKAATPAPAETPAVAPAVIPVAPANPSPDPAPATVNAAAVPSAPAPTPAPATTEKAFTFDDITAAGSQLLEQGKMTQLMELLKGYGVQAVTQLKPEQYAGVAAGLRQLGAKI